MMPANLQRQTQQQIEHDYARLIRAMATDQPFEDGNAAAVGPVLARANKSHADFKRDVAMCRKRIKQIAELAGYDDLVVERRLAALALTEVIAERDQLVADLDAKFSRHRDRVTRLDKQLGPFEVIRRNLRESVPVVLPHGTKFGKLAYTPWPSALELAATPAK
jgi:hypothetical protein